jgi:hypothetical protein
MLNNKRLKANGWAVGWTVEKMTVTEAGRDGHREWSKTKDILFI